MSTLWVFGYGSLIWHPGFQYSQSKVGKIMGYERRFYQGSVVHRGSKQQMGRVVTLVEREEVPTWGRAYQFTDEESALAYLGNRESSIGGYSTVIAQFYPRDSKEKPFPVLVYIALPSNSLFVGSAPMDQIANDIVKSSGENGHNIEYLAKIMAFMSLHVPEHYEQHLFSLNSLVRSKLTQLDSSLISFFDECHNHDNIADDNNVWYNKNGFTNDTIDVYESSSSSSSVSDESEAANSSSSGGKAPSRYTDTVPSRKLRCINK